MVKMKRALALFPLAICFSSAHVLAAATTSDLEKRLEEQEKQITRLENRLKGTRSAVKENRSRIADQNERLKINGFMTAGAAVLDGNTDVEEPYYGLSNNYSTAAVSKLGVQMTFRVSDKVDATAQLVSRGTNNYNVEAEWAYLSYKVTNDLQLNFGRQRDNYYLLSEYLDVGYALPWVLPPIELYNIPISATDGISAIYNFNLSNWNFTWQSFGGQSSGRSDQLQANFTQKNSWGTSLMAENGNWTFRVGYNTSSLDATADAGGKTEELMNALHSAQYQLQPALEGMGFTLPTAPQWIKDIKNLRTKYKSFGFSYDNGNLLVLGEIANLTVTDAIQPVGDAGYLTVGYRFGKWMPYVTFSKFQTDSSNDKQVRAEQAYANAVGQASYLAALGLNDSTTGINAAFGGAPANVVYAQSACAQNTQCNTQVLTAMGIRDQFLTAAEGLGSTIYNLTEAQIEEQQSYTLGLTYDVTPRVKAKMQVTQFERFGSSTFQNLNYVTDAATGTRVYSGFSNLTTSGNGRFTGDPGAAGSHTALYAFSVDAVF